MKTFELIMSLCLFVLGLCIVALVSILVLSKFSSGIYEAYCEDSGGKPMFYECQEVMFSNSSCKDLKTGWWCDYPDGHSITKEQIDRVLNSTQVGLT